MSFNFKGDVSKIMLAVPFGLGVTVKATRVALPVTWEGIRAIRRGGTGR